MPIFDFDFTVDADLAAVSAFHSDTNALKLLNPPPIILQMHQIDPLDDCSISEFSLWLGPLPIRWRAEHSDVGPNGFTDTQTQGPLASWRHTHRFEAIDNQTTRIHEHIKYEYAPGLKGLLSRLMFSPIPLYFLFTYRKWATRKALKG